MSQLALLESTERPESDVLKEAFTHFDAAASNLEKRYHLLTDKIGDLQQELAHKNMLLEHLEERVQRTNRLAAMGEMAAKIAHEIRNPLGSIELFASLVRRDLHQSGHDAAEMAEHIVSGVRSMDLLITNLLFFTKPQRPQCAPIRLSDVIKDALIFATHAISQHGIEVCWEPLSSEEESDYLLADEGLLRQACLNLILNAAQAMEPGGLLRIRVCTSDEGIGDRVTQVSFSDTGVGIARSDLAKMFDPFFSTKERGTGLGLTIAHTIVEAHHGCIEVESKEGEGSTFRLTFPNAPIEREDADVKCVY